MVLRYIGRSNWAPAFAGVAALIGLVLLLNEHYFFDSAACAAARRAIGTR